MYDDDALASNGNGTQYGDDLWDDADFSGYSAVPLDSGHVFFIFLTLVHVFVVVIILGPAVWLGRLCRKVRTRRAERDKPSRQSLDDMDSPYKEFIDGLTTRNIEALRDSPLRLGHYDVYDWYYLPYNIKRHARVLGYNQKKWDSQKQPDTCLSWWKDLTQKQQKAAGELGYDQEVWDANAQVHLANKAAESAAAINQQSTGAKSNSDYIQMLEPGFVGILDPPRKNKAAGHTKRLPATGTSGETPNSTMPELNPQRKVTMDDSFFDDTGGVGRPGDAFDDQSTHEEDEGVGAPVPALPHDPPPQAEQSTGSWGRVRSFWTGSRLSRQAEAVADASSLMACGPSCLDTSERTLDSSAADYAEGGLDSVVIGEAVAHMDNIAETPPVVVKLPIASILASRAFRRARRRPSRLLPRYNQDLAGQATTADNVSSSAGREQATIEEEAGVDFEDFDWDELPQRAKDDAAVLGYTQEIWDADQETEISDLWWRELNPEQQAAARRLGQTPLQWDNEERNDEEVESLQATMTRGRETLRRVMRWDWESRKIMKLAIPATVDASAEPILDAIETALIATNLGPRVFIAYALTNVFISVTDSLINGVGEAEELLVTQAIGLRNYCSAGQYAQLTMILYTVTSIPAYAFWVLYGPSVVLALGMSVDIAEMVKQYIPLAVVGTYVENIVGSLDRLMWCSDKGGTMTIIDTGFDVVYVVALVVSIYCFGVQSLVTIGWLRIAIHVVYSAFLVVYIVWRGWLDPFWEGLSRHLALENANLVYSLVKMALPLSIASLVSHGEWELLTLFAAHMGPTEAAAWSIAGELWEVFEYVPMGIATAAEIRVGFHLGRGDPATAKISAYKCMMYATLLSICSTGVFLVLRHAIIGLFTDDETIRSLLDNLVALLCIGNVVMVVGSTAHAIISTQSRPKLATLFYLLTVVCITFPLSAYLVLYHDFGLDALLFSTVTGYISLSSLLLFLTFTSSWPAISAAVIKEANAVSSSGRQDGKQRR